ncbi:acetyl-CoA carboxylase biotin carboxyl carrier protein subunit [Bradyrhizobium sp.]|uniref:acetyl-CoA carboxylase biotin carboxyl carrier protein n=1 Tax=Bradyrhizobium sp. TaxID=376 RepID=UPI0025C4F8F9|nr:acetyl-CoA carboxylase biotin carboxyl carrier protein subunit [Bradyrhizobium sp.]
MRGKNSGAGALPPLLPDAELIRTLAKVLAETGLTEIEYAVGEHRIRIARGANGAAAAPTYVVPAPAAAAPPPAPPKANGADHSAGLADALRSPMVGIAYLASQPGAAPFVRAGDTVSEGQTLLIIEAMKVMNQIRAPRAGRDARVLIGDAEPVEYGAPLMVIE